MTSLRALLALALVTGGAARADQSTPPAPKPAAGRCEAPSSAVAAEIHRLLKAAGEHASHSQVCIDGDGETTTIKPLSLCVTSADAANLQVVVRYHVTVARELGGECSPFPDCAKPPPPHEVASSATLRFSAAADGLRVILPTALPAVSLLTPLARRHKTGCHADAPAFVPRVIARAP
jgi:hypothetical protein